MMRVMGKSLLVAAVALIAVSPAQAAPFKDYSHLADARLPLDTSGAGERWVGPYTTGFESPEFNLGDIGTVAGNGGYPPWTALLGNPADPSINQQVVNTNGRPGNSLKLGKDPRYGCTPTDVPPGRVRGARANNLDPTFSVMNTDIYIPGVAAGGADFVLQPQAVFLGWSTARVRFTYTGQILVADFINGVYIDTGIGVAYDNWMTVEFVMHPAPTGATYDVYLGPDKQNLVLVVAGAGAVDSSQGFIDNYAVYGDNCQNFAADPNEGAYLDNVEHKPEPGSLALLAIGGLLAARRRK